MSKKIKLSINDKVALAKAKELIEERFDEMPSLQELRMKSGLNVDKLKKGFKLLFGKPPYAYHCQLKMEQAKKLLLETDQAIYEIAWSLGYEHSSNFCIEFKRYSGYRPGEFRRVNKGVCEDSCVEYSFYSPHKLR